MLAPLIICAAWLLYTGIAAFQSYQTKIPGPWYTNLTTLVLKYYEFTRRRRTWIHGLHQKYGPVVRVAPNEVSFSNLEGMKEIYQSGGSGYDKTEFYDLFKQYGHRTMFTTLNRHDHAKRRKLFAERYAMTNILRSTILGGIRQRAAAVIDKCKASQGGYLDVYVTLHCYALDCASHFLFSPGGSWSLTDAKDFKLMQELSYHDSLKRTLIHPLKMNDVLTRLERWIQHYWPVLDKINTLFKPKSTPLSHDFVLSRSQQRNPDEASLLHKLQSKTSELTPMQTAAESMDHLAAGIDTTGDGLCFLMHELSLPHNRARQQRLQQEISSNPAAKLDELPYLDALIKEGLRLFSPIPMSHPRYVPAGGRRISDFDVPGGTIVSCQPYSLHLLNEAVYPNGDTFIPERWLEKEGDLDRNRLFFAFSSGGRGCIGKNLALVEMKTLLREIYSRFTTTVAKEMRGDMSIDDQIIASRPKGQTCLLVFEDRVDV